VRRIAAGLYWKMTSFGWVPGVCDSYTASAPLRSFGVRGKSSGFAAPHSSSTSTTSKMS
jgi:hypothetical protein